MYVSCQAELNKKSDIRKNSLYELDLTYDPSILISKMPKYKKDVSTESSTPKSPLQELICCVCGGEYLLMACEKPGCPNKFHSFCQSYYFPELSGPTAICPSHSFNHLEECSKLLHLSNQFNSSPLVPELLASRQTSSSPDTKLSGNFFWFCISLQYFPYFHPAKPDFSESRLQTPPAAADDSWISSQISQTNSALQASHSKTLHLLKPLQYHNLNYSKNPKPGENLENSHKLPLALQGKFIRKYEKSQIRSIYSTLDPTPKPDSPALCSICLQSGSNHPLLNCFNCSLNVHSKCYQPSEPADYLWLCDLCKAHPLSTKSCSLCSVTGGALKVLRSGSWVHISCARFLQDCHSNDLHLDVEKINSEKFKLKCLFCSIKVGACVQCSFGRCANAFHVECGKSLFDVDQGTWLCPNHKASRLTRQVKSRFESNFVGFKEMAEEMWRVVVGVKEPSKRKYVKTAKGKSKAKVEKTKIVVEFKEESALLKVYKNGKLAKVMKYVEAGEQEKVIKAAKNCIKLNNLPLAKDLKRPRKTETCLKVVKDDLNLKMVLPQVLLTPASLKKQKLFS